MKRVFLDWDGGLLPRATKWLVEEFGVDMRGVVVALPGARAGRILQELLAREVGAAFRPPRVVTAGMLSDELLEVQGIAAGRLVRTLAWEQALRRLPKDQLSRIVARLPADDDRAAWSALAEEVRGLFGEIAAEGLDFATVAESKVLKGLVGEVQRWRALEMAQQGMVSLLDEAGLHDPHLGRLAAIEANCVREPRHVVLIGVVEVNDLLRRTLRACQSEQTALVFAPELEVDRFDEFGCLITSAWIEWQPAMKSEQWHVTDRPGDQARAAAGVIASWGGAFRAEQISIGLIDAEVSPFVKSRLAESGIRARDAAGIPMARTAVIRLLAAIGASLRSNAFHEFAVLVRHPDFESAMLRAAPNIEPIDTLDEYHGEHLPWRADGEWSADPSNKYDIALLKRMKAVWDASRVVMAEFLAEQSLAIGAQAAAIRSFLGRIYAGRELDTGSESGRVMVASLRCLASGLGEIADLPASLAPKGSMADTIDLLLRVVSSRSNDVPSAAARAGEATIEMMGWLELSLDDAPALVVTGFQDGKVPESVRGDAYLPNRLRHDLGIVDNEKRLARDLYATELLLRSRDRVAFISGRRNLAGDPLVPSRIVFHCAEDEIVGKVNRFLSGRSTKVARVESAYQAVRELPRGEAAATPEVISVSAFKTFLESPYAYYLQYVLKLDTLDDRAREMDGAAFGNLAHAVLQRFGQDERARQEQDPEKIAAFLTGTLRAMGREIYGHNPQPAVQLQLQQLALRLRRFSESQAKRRSEGWRIYAVEWGPEGGAVDFDVDGKVIKLRGRIDRIDFHETRREWAIWDYKAGDRPKTPLIAHRRSDGAWTDLQLPLYSYMTEALLEGAKPKELGYIAIGRDSKSSGFRPVKDWRRPKDECDSSDEALSKGLEQAREIVRKIRAGEFFELDGWQAYDKIFAAIGGAALMAMSADAEDGAQ